MATEIYQKARVRNVLVLKHVSQFIARKKEISSPCLGDNILGKKQMQIKNAVFKIWPCEEERKERRRESTQLQNWENVIFLGFGKLNTLSKAFGCPYLIQSMLHGWVIQQHRNVLSVIWKHCLR